MFWLDETIQEGDISAAQCAIKAGISINAVSCWRRGQSPSIGNFDAVLNVLGYKLAVVPL
jgi:transcriptional regulator with XRE-family HTH domain